MTTIKAGLTGAAVGALTVAGFLFAAPVAAQAPGTTAEGSGSTGQADRREFFDPRSMMGPGQGRDMGPGMRGPGSAGRGGFDDRDITGPRGDVGPCQERVARAAQARLDRIERFVRPTAEQRAAFDALAAASAKAAELLRSACPTTRPATPPARMAAAEKWLDARLQAVKTLRPALESFYQALSDEQKMAWMGASDEGRWTDDRGDRWQRWREPDRRGEDRWSDRGRDWRGPDRDRWDRWRDRWHDWHDRFGRDGDRDDYADRWRHRWHDEGRDRWGDRWRDRPDYGPEYWRDWRERFGYREDRGDPRERWQRRWREDDRDWRERDRFRDQDRGLPPRRGDDGRSRPTAPDEESL